jgi:hypothetical protein
MKSVLGLPSDEPNKNFSNDHNRRKEKSSQRYPTHSYHNLCQKYYIGTLHMPVPNYFSAQPILFRPTGPFAHNYKGCDFYAQVVYFIDSIFCALGWYFAYIYKPLAKVNEITSQHLSSFICLCANHNLQMNLLFLWKALYLSWMEKNDNNFFIP